MCPAATGKEAATFQAQSLVPYANAVIDWSVIEWHCYWMTLLLNELYVWAIYLDQTPPFFLINLFSSMLWVAQGGDRTEFNQIKHSRKPNLTQHTGREITFSAGCVPWWNLQLRYINEGDRESEQLGTRMVGLTMLVTGQIYVRLKRLHSCFLKRAHIGKAG